MNRSFRGAFALLLLFLFGTSPAMAQSTKISGLPSATLPLAGTEVVAVVQGGVTKKAPASAFGTGGSGGTSANPTATIGATAVNGTATTYMTSDSAPALPSTLPAISGVNLTNLNGSNVASGTVPPTRLPVGKSVADPGTGVLESLLPVQTVTGTNKTYATADLQYETRRSNSGSAMTDTFPASSATGLVNGARITVNNIDATASDTISAGAGTTVNGGSTLVAPPSRSLTFVYDSASTAWRTTFNTSTAIVGPASATSGNLASFADTTGKVASDSGKATPAGAIVGTTDTQTLTNKSISGSEINSGTIPAAQLPVATPVTTISTSGSTQTISFPSTGNASYDVTLSANCTFTITGGTVGQTQLIYLYLRQGGSGGFTPTLPAGVKWPGSVTPTYNTATGHVDYFILSTPDAGTTIVGNY